MAEQPWTSPPERVWMAWRSACIPAPPDASDPAIVRIVYTHNASGADKLTA